MDGNNSFIFLSFDDVVKSERNCSEDVNSLENFDIHFKGCPQNFNLSTMAEICQISAALVSLLHAFFSIFASKTLRKYYGGYLIAWFFLSALKNVQFVISAYLSEEHRSSHVCIVNAMLLHAIEVMMAFILIVNLLVVLKKLYNIENLPYAKTYSALEAVHVAGRPKPKWKILQRLSSVLLIFIVPSLPVGLLVGLNQSATSVEKPFLKFNYGQITCGDIGSCLLPMQFFLYIPVLILTASQWVLIFIIKRHYGLSIFTHQMPLFESTMTNSIYSIGFSMTGKIVICQTLLSLQAWISNVVCHLSLWHLYNILDSLKGIFLLVNFVLSRATLEVFFKRDDPLRHLKIGSLALAMNIQPMHSNNPAAKVRWKSTTNFSQKRRNQVI